MVKESGGRLTAFIDTVTLQPDGRRIDKPTLLGNVVATLKGTDTNDDGILDSDVDTNDDGEIQVSEALAVSNLNTLGNTVRYLTGINAFTNLKSLVCTNAYLQFINISGLTNPKASNDRPASHRTFPGGPESGARRAGFER